MSRKQIGGNDNSSVSLTTPPALTIPSDLIISGGSACGNKKKCAKKGKGKAKGGALVEDIKSLAVPFAILLAKEGLEKMFKKNKPVAKKSKSTATRKRAAVGGNCTSCAPPVKGGGGGKSKFAKLSDEIDRFLKKH
jgi:hypothetical protein